MKKVYWILLLFLILLLGTTMAKANNSIIVYPYYLPEYHVTTETEVILGAGWGTCRRGLTQSFLKSIEMDWYINGDLVFDNPNEENQYWGPVEAYQSTSNACLGDNPHSLWRTYFRYSLGTLNEGVYLVRLYWWADHPIGDLIDYDGDGAPDFWLGPLGDHYTTVYVTAPE